MIELFQQGGLVMYPILACSIIFVAILIERLFHLHRAQINTGEFIAGIRTIIKKRNMAEAISICEETPGPVAHVIQAGLVKHDRPKAEIKEAIDDAALHEVPRLEKNLVVLATIAHIAPLLGLFGTVLGMIDVFRTIESLRGSVQPGRLAGGIGEALITTAAGLAVAIPVFIAYNYLVSRVGALVWDMERSATEVVDLLTQVDEVDLLTRPDRGNVLAQDDEAGLRAQAGEAGVQARTARRGSK
jgi:biopolymer transport protein ExbB